MAAMTAERLDSWKQIATYLKRSVRTVRRWERDEGLPVHRHMHRALASVFALRSEIDTWRQGTTRSPASPPSATRDPQSAAVRSIAVLPFANLCAEEAENVYFVDGLTEEVTTTLSRVHSLRVISRSSSARLRGTTQGAKSVGRQLGVRYLLQGSVRRSGGQLRISAQLIDAANDQHLWSDTYDGTLDDVFAIQERLARVIVEALQLQLSTPETKGLTERAIPNLAAYECYLRARHESWRWRQDSIDHSIRLLRQALTLIGDNARLHAALGLAHLQYRESGIDLSERPLLNAENCVSKVFALEPDAPAGLQLRGWTRYARGLIQDAVRDLKAALAAEPNNADTLLLLSNCYLISGRVAAARPLLKHLLAIDPLTPITRCMPAFADIMEGKLAAAIKPYRQMLEMDQGNPMARLFYAWILLLNGRRAAARALVAAFPKDVRGSLPARIALFLTRTAARERRAAQAALTAQVEALAGAPDVFPRFLAQGFALAGMREPALKWLQVAIERGFINYPFLARHDPCFKALRHDSRFQELLAMVRERWQQFEA
jgi:TolB-like protein/Flp pilus assembly protein TadD